MSNNKLCNLIFVAAMVTFSGSSQANGSVSNMTISSITTGPYNGLNVVIITMAASHSNPDSCTYGNTVVIKSDQTTFKVNSGLSMLAKAEDYSVSAYVAGCYELYSGSGTYPLVYNLTIQ